MQIKDQKKAESLAAVIIALFILSIALVGIINVVSFSKGTASSYEKEIFKYILKSNSENIVKKVDLSALSKNEKFYLYKDTVTKEFTVLTGAVNDQYKYISPLGETIANTIENTGKIYKREFTQQSDILKHSIDPINIPNLVFQFDAMNPNGNDIAPADGSSISTWVDLANGNNASKKWSTTSPTYLANGLNGKPMIQFNGTSDLLEIPKNIDINNDNVCDTDLTYKQKSFSMVIKTGNDVTRKQAIYEQGGVATGYNIMINNGDLYAGIHNNTDPNTNYFCYYDRTQDWDTGNKLKSVNLGQVLPNTTYYLTIVQDSSNTDINGEYIDNLNKLQIFLNGELVSEALHVDPQAEHDIGGFGGITDNNVEPWSPYNTINCSECYYFEGGIGEYLSWNHALSPSEVRGIHNYLLEKWLGGKQSIEFSTTQTDINKYISN